MVIGSPVDDPQIGGGPWGGERPSGWRGHLSVLCWDPPTLIPDTYLSYLSLLLNKVLYQWVSQS